jgi:tripeptidyl-peptidase-2
VTTAAGGGGDAQEDAKCRIAQLRALEKEWEDVGPVYDCLTFHDGERWQAAVDTTETGDFAAATQMTDYRVSRQFSTFDSESNLNYAVNVFDDGATLSLVCDCGAHGTHVASIAAAYCPEQPECNGVAPGAQIVSLKIGDTRLGSTETAVGLSRGLTEAVRRGCHVLNMSYGEATAWGDSGAFSRLTDDLVRTRGITFVGSAGNNGPCLSTVGAPGGTTASCIGVGAYVTKSLMSAAYSLLTDLPETGFNWSSAGPALEGEIGVSVLAPGGAVTGVPTWTLNGKQLMNGTSMAAPHVAGCVALLLSAARAAGVPTSPVSLRRALENSAAPLPEVSPLVQGSGLVQLSRAWTLLSDAAAGPHAHVSINVKIAHPSFSSGASPICLSVCLSVCYDSLSV